MAGVGVPPTTIRVPPDGVTWLAEACAQGEWQLRHPGDGILVPAGVTFDSLEMPCATGRYVMRWLMANKRHLGPVAVDSRAGRTRFLIPPASGVIVPDIVAELIGAGHQVRLPSRVTTGDALLRWLIVPRTRHPRLTDPADLLAAITTSLDAESRQRPVGPIAVRP